MSRRTYRPRYPYTLLREALDRYRAEVFHDDAARGRFLVHIQPVVRHCVGRVVSEYSNRIVRNNAEDMVSYVNLYLLRSWLPRYLGSRRKMQRWREAVKYFSKTVRGCVLHYFRDTRDPRLVLLGDIDEAGKPAVDRAIERMDQEEIDAAVEEKVQLHLALRRRPEVVEGVVRKMARYMAWEGYDRTGEIAC